MSGKIKSTIELAMEKAAKLPRLTKQEIRQQQEKTYGPRGRAIAARFLAADLGEEDLEGQLSDYQGEQAAIVREAFLAEMCRAMDLEHAEAIARAFEGIRALAGDDLVEEASRRVKGIVGDYQARRGREFARAEEVEGQALRELGVSGSAIRPNTEQSRGWLEKRGQLLEEFRPALEEINRELRDHLRRVVSGS